MTIGGCGGLRASPQGAPTNRRPPNILFLISDDHSAADLGCYGNSAVRTPNLDRLATQGTRFTRAFVTSPQCSPSRSSIYAGQWAHTIGTSRLHAPVRSHVPTIIDLLKGRDYFTGIYRKHHLGGEFEKRLDFYGGPKEPFQSFFDRLPRGKPFFLQIGFTDPHRPYQKGAVSPPHDPQQVRVPAFLPDSPAVREDLALYYDEISRMDSEAGQALELLERRGLAGDTLVLFTGDNGMPFPRAKCSLYDSGIRVPLLVRWPGRVRPGTVSEELVSLIDLPETWLEAVGAPVPPIMRGRSLLALLEGRGEPARETVFAERNWHDNLDLIRCVRTRRYKLIQNFQPEKPYRPSLDLEGSPSWQSYLALGKSGRLSAVHRQLLAPRRPEVELYDLEKDPDEFRNLAGEASHAETVRRLQETLSEWMQATNDFLPPAIGSFPRGLKAPPSPL